MTVRSRDQASLLLAEHHVQQVAANYPLTPDDAAGKTPEQLDAYRKTQEQLRKNYGRLCHSFPVLVRRSGLIQAVGFLQAKGTGDSPGKAGYALLLPHVADIVEPLSNNQPHTTASVEGLPVRLAERDLVDLMVTTRRLIDAWVHYKHFAESILGASSASDGEGDD